MNGEARREILAIIPARGGSKGVPRKNIRPLAGKPLIAYAIEAGLKSPSVGRVIVSTEDAEIARIAGAYGAEVPFVRPLELAGDDIHDPPVFRHALRWLEENEGYRPDFVLNLRCTTPFKSVEDVEAVIKKLDETGCDSVRTMTLAQGIHHPYWMYKERGGLAEPFVDGLDISRHFRRQLLPPVYRLNGVVDGARRSVMLQSENFWGERMAIVEIPEERAIDIDTEFDFEFAEFMMGRPSR